MLLSLNSEFHAFIHLKNNTISVSYKHDLSV